MIGNLKVNLQNWDIVQKNIPDDVRKYISVGDIVYGFSNRNVDII